VFLIFHFGRNPAASVVALTLPPPLAAFPPDPARRFLCLRASPPPALSPTPSPLAAAPSSSALRLLPLLPWWPRLDAAAVSAPPFSPPSSKAAAAAAAVVPSPSPVACAAVPATANSSLSSLSDPSESSGSSVFGGGACSGRALRTLGSTVRCRSISSSAPSFS
jgi:hypothetical protein